MEINFYKCQREFLLLPCLNYYHYSYLTKLDFSYKKEISIGWLFWFIRINVNTLKPNFKSISILPEINFVWYKPYYFYIAIRWINFSKIINIKYGKNKIY